MDLRSNTRRTLASRLPRPPSREPADTCLCLAHVAQHTALPSLSLHNMLHLDQNVRSEAMRQPAEHGGDSKKQMDASVSRAGQRATG